jgi:TPR repeat protein
MKILKIHLILSIVFLMCTVDVLAKSYEPEWLLDIKNKALNGDINNQIELAKLYRGKVCFYEALHKGRPFCLFEEYNIDELPFFQNHFEAVKWFKLAAKQGSFKAQHELAFMYENGLGVRQNFFEALMWYKTAAKQGCSWSQSALGAMYEEGHGVKRNYLIAKEWYGKACDNHNTFGCRRYKELNEKGD